MSDEIMDARWIMKLLPHRYPMLLVDRVLELEKRERIVALKNVSINEPFFQGHFPGLPVMPGVLLVEGLAQAAGVLTMHGWPERYDKPSFLTSIARARFRRPVVPGDQLIYEVEVLRMRTAHGKLKGRVLVEGKVAAEATISSAMVDL